MPVFTFTPGPSPVTPSPPSTRLHGRLEPGPAPGRRTSSPASSFATRTARRSPFCTAQYAGTGKQVALNGSASEDPEGFNLKEYKWYADGKPRTADREGVVALWDAATSGTHSSGSP